MKEYLDKEFNVKLLKIEPEDGRSYNKCNHLISQNMLLTFVEFAEDWIVAYFDFEEIFESLRTSQVKNINENKNNNQLILTTNNTIYTFEILSEMENKIINENYLY